MAITKPASVLALLASTTTALTLALAPSPASAAHPAVATGNVNLRAGPGVGYPVVITVPAGAPIVTHGCLADHSWCDTSWGPNRGWMSASYIQVVHAGRAVVLTPALMPAIGIGVETFNQAYWHAYYVGRPWYARWHYYNRVPYGTRSVTRSCGGGSCTRTVVRTGPYGGQVTRSRTITRY